MADDSAGHFSGIFGHWQKNNACTAHQEGQCDLIVHEVTSKNMQQQIHTAWFLKCVYVADFFSLFGCYFQRTSCPLLIGCSEISKNTIFFQHTLSHLASGQKWRKHIQ